MCKHSWQKIEVPQTLDIGNDEVWKMKEEGIFADMMAKAFGWGNWQVDGGTVIVYVRIGRRCTKCPKEIYYPNWC